MEGIRRVHVYVDTRLNQSLYKKKEKEKEEAQKINFYVQIGIFMSGVTFENTMVIQSLENPTHSFD